MNYARLALFSSFCILFPSLGLGAAGDAEIEASSDIEATVQTVAVAPAAVVGSLSLPKENLPESEIELEKSLQPAAILDLPAADKYVLMAELDAGKLHVFEKGRGLSLTKVKTFPVSIGKKGYGKRIEGDKRTPVGVYRVTSHLTDEQLDDFYGDAAYPLNYPNVWDRLQNYSGSGIWLHGEPSDKKERPLFDSDGCIVLSNGGISEIAKYLNVGYTKVLSTPKISWVSGEEVKLQREALTEEISSWLDAWQPKKHNEYMGFYSQDFSDTEKNYQQWDKYKKRVNGRKRFIKVAMSDLGLYAYPGQSNMVMAEFFQDYRSNNYRSTGWKRQLWRKEEDGRWRIIYERGG